METTAKNTVTDLQVIDTKANETLNQNTQALQYQDNLQNPTYLDQLQRVAKMFSSSIYVPDIFKGNIANTAIAIDMAYRIGLNPGMVLQKTYVIKGKPAMEAQLVIAMVNKSGIFTRLRFKLEGEGENRRCTCFATEIATGEKFEATVSMTMAKAEGWLNKEGSKWRTLPDLMLSYRSAMFFSRLYCPEILFGLYSNDELQDVADVEAKIVSLEDKRGKKESHKSEIMCAETIQECEKETPKEEPKLVEQTKVNFDDVIPGGTDQELLNKFMSMTAKHLNISVEAVKEEALKDKENFFNQFGIWATKKANGNNKGTKQATHPEPAKVTDDLAPATCPNRPGETMTAQYCNTSCDYRKGCPVWE